MWGARYWGARYWGTRYWGKVGAEAAIHIVVRISRSLVTEEIAGSARIVTVPAGSVSTWSIGGSARRLETGT